MQMRVFLIANTESVWTKEFIENVLLPEGCTVDMQKNTLGKGKFDDFYQGHNVSFVAPYEVAPFIMKIPRIRVWVSMYQRLLVLKKLKHYDRVIIIFVTPFEMECAKMVVSSKGTVYPLFVGSDILRANKLKVHLLNYFLCQSKVSIVCETMNVLNGCRSKLSKKLHYNHAGFGISMLKKIDEIRNENAKMYLGISNSKITICIGYNGRTAQQHLKVLDVLKDLDEKIKSKLFLLLPLTYGSEKKYILKLKKKLSELKIEYRMFEQYLGEDIAHIWLAADLFINAQTTDGMSKSVLECLYSGVFLLNAKWLDYPEFKMLGLKYETFNTFSQIPNIISRFVNGEITYTNSNMAIIKKSVSWNACRSIWGKLLK